MDNLEERLNSILSNPESLSQLSHLAEGILGNSGENNCDTKNDSSNDGGLGFDLATVARLQGMLGNLREDSEDSRLLLALKPYLKEKRKAKVDETVKLMKLMKLAPLLKDIKL